MTDDKTTTPNVYTVEKIMVFKKRTSKNLNIVFENVDFTYNIDNITIEIYSNYDMSNTFTNMANDGSLDKVV
jgi:hypothetical protein